MYPASEPVNFKECAVESRILDSIFTSMNSYIERLTKINARLVDISIRAFGPIPECPAAGSVASMPSGSVGEIQYSHARIEEMLSAIEDALKKVERIA